jgi:hypothetical protein
MAKSKYTEETVKKICEAIARDGCDEPGWLAGGISKDTFYQWQNKYPEFSDLIAQAKADFKKFCPEEVSRLAHSKLIDALENGQTIKRRSQTIKQIRHYNKEGNLFWSQEHIETKEHDDVMPTPKWAIDRVIPRPTNELEALEVLIDAGWIPREVLEAAANGVSELRETIKQAFRGITPSSQ